MSPSILLVGRMPHIVEVQDVKKLLKKAVSAAGGQSAWARKFGIPRSVINLVLQGKRKPTRSIITALGLKIVYIKELPLRDRSLKVADCDKVGGPSNPTTNA
jgi:hypothetical protein